MRLHKDDFEILKVIGRGAFGEVSIIHRRFMNLLMILQLKKGKLNAKLQTLRLLLFVYLYLSDYNRL